jgi:stearoyl-CoA desaturase (delta-9 desaturase)
MSNYEESVATLDPPLDEAPLPAVPEIVTRAKVDAAPPKALTPDPHFKPGKRWIVLKKLDWAVLLGITGMHIGSLFALNPAYFSWSGLVLFAALYWLTANVGITLCFHRLLTHHSFKTPKWFKYVLTGCGCLAWQGGPVQWVGTHRIHHKHSDQEWDPHSPVKHGFTWGHMLWCMHKEPDNAKAIDAAKDLKRDKVIWFMNRFFFIPNLLLLPLFYLGGEWAKSSGLAAGASGLSWMIWGVALRIAFVYHVTWFVNSAAHTWGYRNYKTADRSTNLWWVALLSWGEGWHNNHHAHQRSASHGLRWFEFDMTYWQIKVLSLFGLATDIVLPSKEDRP